MGVSDIRSACHQAFRRAGVRCPLDARFRTPLRPLRRPALALRSTEVRLAPALGYGRSGRRSPIALAMSLKMTAHRVISGCPRLGLWNYRTAFLSSGQWQSTNLDFDSPARIAGPAVVPWPGVFTGGGSNWCSRASEPPPIFAGENLSSREQGTRMTSQRVGARLSSGGPFAGASGLTAKWGPGTACR